MLATSPRPTGFVCRSCLHRTITTEASNTSRIPPESPRFIEVPQPPQKFLQREQRVRGKLPVPRNLFPHGTKEKASPLWLDAVTRNPRNTSLRPIEGDELQRPQHMLNSRWNRNMAERRRMNLRQGVLEMHQRDAKARHVEAKRANTAKELRAHAEEEPARSDELFSGQSITEVLRDIYKRDQGRANHDIARKRANFQKRAKRAEQQRADAVHTLYMHAQDFITTEEGLEEAIQKAFHHEDGTPKFDSIWGSVEDTTNAPMTTLEMLQRSHGNDTSQRYLRTAVASQRMKKLAETLTGGKMSTT